MSFDIAHYLLYIADDKIGQIAVCPVVLTVHDLDL